MGMRLNAAHIALIAWMLAAASPLALAQVRVEKKPPTVQTRYFDPKNKPADMPPLDGKEAAVTQSSFSISARMEAQVVDQEQLNGQWVTQSKVTGVTATLELDIVIWLPHGANAKLIAHEEGHRRISEMFYQDAEKHADTLARQWVGKTLRGQGPTRQEATQRAMRQVTEQLTDQYIKAIDGPSGRVQTIYDQLTDHGRNALDEDAAIHQAMKQAQEEKAGRR
jgi:hypothetical protein